MTNQSTVEIPAYAMIFFGSLYEKTLDTEKRLYEAGYKVVSIWESEWVEQQGGKYYSYPERFI